MNVKCKTPWEVVGSTSSESKFLQQLHSHLQGQAFSMACFPSTRHFAAVNQKINMTVTN